MDNFLKTNPENSIEKIQEEPIFKLVLVRHEHTNYEGSDPSLSAQGFLDAEELGKQLTEEGLLSKEVSPIFLHSPQKRASQTLEGIVKGAGLNSNEASEMRAINQLRTADKGPNYHEFIDAGMKVINEEGSFNSAALDKITANQYGDDPLYNSRPDVVETKDSRRSRLYRSLEYLIRWFDKHDMTHGQQVIAVSHFEIIMHIIDDVFDIETFDTHNLPDFGDCVRIESYKIDDTNVVKLKIRFRERVKVVEFDRSTRALIDTKVI